MTLETKIRNYLLNLGKEKSEASREAFLAVDAIMNGEIDQRTALVDYGVSPEEYQWALHFDPEHI